MPKPISVVLAAHDPEWAHLAARETERLGVLGPTLLAVHHIGSTAVPGLAAKPIIDLMPLVTTLADLDRGRGRLERLGYDWHGELGIAGRRYCSLSDSGRRVAQLHFFSKDSPQVARHLAFGDYLRAHPAAVRAYEAEKRRAQALHPNDSHAYNDAKNAWIRAAETEALRWAAELGPVTASPGRGTRPAAPPR